MEVESMIAGAALFTSGIAAGKIARFRRGPSPNLTCGCTHNLAFHDPETTECNATINLPNYNSHGERCGNQWMACACLRYTGQMPEYLVQDKQL